MPNHRVAPVALVTSLIVGCGGPGEAPEANQSPVSYEISFENRAHHEAEISVTFRDVAPGPLEVRMSRSSPGRYALHEFAKNVYDVRATDGAGAELPIARPDPHQWNVSGHDGTVTISYTLYGDRADGTYTGIDRTHGHLNMPATFMWARGMETRPVELRVDVPDDSGWQVGTQLVSTDDPNRFTAPDLAYFLDSPTEVSAFWEREWSVDGQTIRVVLHHDGADVEAEEYTDAVARIVEASRDIYGELPEFDFGRYTFLACYLPWVAGDGMEHRNSTVLTSTSSLATNMTGVLGTVAHEFFHAWSIERIRPATLEPFDFEAANMSRELWFGEGFTSYFDDLILWRAGLVTDEGFASRMGAIANAVTNARGRQFFSPVEMSMQAPFVDAATSVDPQNRQNTFLSYYTWGSGVGMALDLMLRDRFQGVTADHLMREMWSTHGIGEDTYDVADIETALARVTGDEAFAGEFFDRYVRGREAPDYEALLGSVGIDVGLARPDRAWIGPLAMSFDGSAATLASTPLIDSPLWDAGVDRGDRIVSIAGRTPGDRDALTLILADHRPGDRVAIRYESRGESFDTEMTLQQDPALAGRLDGAASVETVARLQSWRSAPTEDSDRDES